MEMCITKKFFTTQIILILFFHKLKYPHTHKENEGSISIQMRTWIFIAALFIITQGMNKSNIHEVMYLYEVVYASVP